MISVNMRPVGVMNTVPVLILSARVFSMPVTMEAPFFCVRRCTLSWRMSCLTTTSVSIISTPWLEACRADFRMCGLVQMIMLYLQVPVPLTPAAWSVWDSSLGSQPSTLTHLSTGVGCGFFPESFVLSRDTKPERGLVAASRCWVASQPFMPSVSRATFTTGRFTLCSTTVRFTWAMKLKNRPLECPSPMVSIAGPPMLAKASFTLAS
mmetsp:Transcript_13465/g.30529  ORF Transcript_13465/g.30529 Transcript_13465/m.30529 type:complete len:208 (+) Transcript_13465:405-1028(+)